MRYDIIVVGAGGTGGNFLKEFGRFLKFYDEPEHTWALKIIDGDSIEERNAERQPFLASDAMQRKAAVMAEGLVDCIGLPREKVTAYTRYIDTYDELKSIIGGAGGYDRSIVLLIGCVDNHRARQVMHEAFNKIPNIIYIDSANEFSEGEVVVGLRMGRKELAPPRGYYFPEVLTDKGKRASELSCGAVNVSAPQHLATNLTAAHHILSFVVNIMKTHQTDGGVVHFDAFSHYCRFDRWTREMQREKEAKEAANKPKRGRRKKVTADGK